MASTQLQRSDSVATTSGRPLGTKPFVLLPLYIYPLPEAWDPLFTVLERHPDVHIKAVINPNNGPGDTPPNSDYLSALRKLQSYSNVEILGYVHVQWGRRLEIDVRADIAEYFKWTKLPGETNLHIDGIFFDEWPSDISLLQRMNSLTMWTREIFLGFRAGTLAALEGQSHNPSGPLPNRGSRLSVIPGTTGFTIVYNPGTVIDAAWYTAADYVVAFENTAVHWDNPHVGGVVKCLPSKVRNKTIACFTQRQAETVA